jgi:transposase-like protein
VLAFYAFPTEDWPKLRSTNALERFNRKIARGTDVVGIFPDDQSLIRLLSMLAIKANDELIAACARALPHRRLSGELLHHLPGLD